MAHDMASGDNINGDKVMGDKVMGDKVINNNFNIAHIDLDIGILKNILENEQDAIKEILDKISKDCSVEYMDETSISISEKNLKNDLSEFYEEFIKINEQKLKALDDFFRDNDYYEEIEAAAGCIKMSIFSYNDRKSFKLTPNLFNSIIQEHTRGVEDLASKNLMKLMIFYLYRYCYIGLKND